MGKHVDWYNADGLRWCSGCQDYMDASLFHKGQPKTPDGLQRQCVICRRQTRRAQYQAHRARDIAYSRAWERAYLATHPEGLKERQRLAHRAYNLRRSLMTGALARRIRRETQHAADLALAQRFLHTQPDSTAPQLATATGWYYTKARRMLLEARGMTPQVARGEMSPHAPHAPHAHDDGPTERSA